MNKLKYIIFFFLINYFASASDWRLVERFDNTPDTSKSDVQVIQCSDSNNCYAFVEFTEVSDASWRLFKSFDQGRTWEFVFKSKEFWYQYHNDPPAIIRLAGAVSTDTNYYFMLSDDYTVVQKSTDGGKTFKKIILDPDSKYPRSIAMYDTSIGIAYNTNSIYSTTDGWETFERHTKLHVNQTYYSPIFLDSNTVVMTSFVTPPLDTHNHMAFMKYHLKENTWDTLFYFESEFKKWGNNVINLFFINDSVGFGCGDGVDFDLPSGNYYDIIYKTTDSGFNWELIQKEYQYPEVGLTNNIAFTDEKNGIAVGFYGKIAMTNDGGETWVYELVPNDMDNARKMLVCWAGRTPLIGTWDAGIFRYEGDFFKFPVGVEDKEITNYELLITPNPASEYIENNFWGEWKREKGEGKREICIYNVYGQCVLSVVANGRSPVQRIDISGFPDGMYFLKLSESYRMHKFVVLK